MEGFFGLPRNTLADKQVFAANSPSAGSDFHSWRKRPGVTMVQIIAIGGGGGGGNGVVGANSTAAGGGGGGSSNLGITTMPAAFLPDELFVSVGFGGASNAAGIASRVAVYPDASPSTNLCYSNGGGAGGNGSGATGGGAGSAATNATVSNCVPGGAFFSTIAGQAGVAGGTTGAGSTVTMPATGLLMMGGCGGGGLPAAAAAGSNGGTYQGTGDWTVPPRGLGGTTATTPGGVGCNGYAPLQGLFFYFGGTGGGSSHGSATGAGLVGGNGGAGGYGCGGGGAGGALTASVQGLGGRGGDGVVYILSW